METYARSVMAARFVLSAKAPRNSRFQVSGARTVDQFTMDDVVEVANEIAIWIHLVIRRKPVALHHGLLLIKMSPENSWAFPLLERSLLRMCCGYQPKNPDVPIFDDAQCECEPL